MEQFFKIIKKEVNTEKSQNDLSKKNTRTFITLHDVKTNDILSAFKKSFGYEPKKINSLTFTKVINNRRNRTSRKVKMKKFFITLPEGKDLTTVNN